MANIEAIERFATLCIAKSCVINPESIKAFKPKGIKLNAQLLKDTVSLSKPIKVIDGDLWGLGDLG